MLVNQHRVSVLAYTRKLENFNFFGVNDAGQVNSRLYALVEVLRMFY